MHIRLVPGGLRAGMHGEMLGAGSGLEIFALALQALYKGYAQPPREIRVLAIGLLAAAPARVAKNVDIGRPERQPLIDVAVAKVRLRIELGARFRGDGFRHLAVEILIKNRGQANGLREHRGRARAGHAVQRLVPPVIGRHAQPLNGGRVVFQLRELFLQSHLIHKRLGQRACFRSLHLQLPFAALLVSRTPAGKRLYRASGCFSIIPEGR